MWREIFKDNPPNYFSYWKEIKILTSWKKKKITFVFQKLLFAEKVSIKWQA